MFGIEFSFPCTERLEMNERFHIIENHYSAFDERNAAVKRMIAQVIAVCRSKKRKIGICGQAPSDYPDFAQFLIEQGIDSISLNPDTVMKTTVAILEEETALKKSASSGKAGGLES